MGWNPLHKVFRKAPEPLGWAKRPDGILVPELPGEIKVGYRQTEHGNEKRTELFLINGEEIMNVDTPGYFLNEKGKQRHVPSYLKSAAMDMREQPARFNAMLAGKEGTEAERWARVEALRARRLDANGLADAVDSHYNEREGLRQIALKALLEDDHERALIAVKMILRMDRDALAHMATK